MFGGVTSDEKAVQRIRVDAILVHLEKGAGMMEKGHAYTMNIHLYTN